MDIYSKVIDVLPEHLDERNHVNNVVYLQWVQDISKEHWMSKTNDDINSKMFWVVRNHHLEYRKQAVLGDQLIIKTFVKSYKGPFSERVVQFYLSDELAVESSSNWCLIDADTSKPMRIPEDLKSLF